MFLQITPGTIHETTSNRTNKAASCGFVDRFHGDPISQNWGIKTLSQEQIVGFGPLCLSGEKSLSDRDQRRLAVGMAQGEIKLSSDIADSG